MKEMLGSDAATYVTTYIKNLKTSNVQHTNVELSCLLCVQHRVDTDDHPQEQPLIDRLGQGTH